MENDINKGEMIPAERAKELIINIIPDKKDHVDKIYKVISFSFNFNHFSCFFIVMKLYLLSISMKNFSVFLKDKFLNKSSFSIIRYYL